MYDWAEARSDGADAQFGRQIREARHLHELDRRRKAMLGDMGEPAWKMLLELFIRCAEGRKTPVKNLCLASGGSTSTAMRWVDRLFGAGLIEKEPDEQDARRTLVSFTKEGWQVMQRILHRS